jgi:hypothetical protein
LLPSQRKGMCSSNPFSKPEANGTVKPFVLWTVVERNGWDEQNVLEILKKPTKFRVGSYHAILHYSKNPIYRVCRPRPKKFVFWKFFSRRNLRRWTRQGDQWSFGWKRAQILTKRAQFGAPCTFV